MNNYLKTFLRGSAISIAGAVLLGFTNYWVRRVLCYNMSLEDYGAFFSTFALFFVIFGFTDLGLTQSGTVMIATSAENKSERDVFFSHLFFIKSAVALLGAAGIAAFYWLNRGGNDIFFLLIFLAYFVMQVFNGTLQALWGGLKKYTLQQAGYCVIALATVFFVCCLPQCDLKSVALCFLAAATTGFLFGLIYSRGAKLGELKFCLDKNKVKVLLSTGGIIAITTTLFTLMHNVSVIMLNWQKGAASAGLYNIALPIMQIVQGVMVFPGVFLPIAVDMSRHHEYTKLRVFVRAALFTALVALIPTGIFFYYSSPLLIRVLFKPEYVGAASATTLLCLGLVFFTLGNFLFQIMLSLNKSVIMTVITVITTVFCLVLNYILIDLAGIGGAATATLISYALFAVMTYVALEFYIKRMKREYENKKNHGLAEK